MSRIPALGEESEFSVYCIDNGTIFAFNQCGCSMRGIFLKPLTNPRFCINKSADEEAWFYVLIVLLPLLNGRVASRGLMVLLK